VTCQGLCSDPFNQTADEMIDAFGAPHWPPSEVLDEALAEVVQAAEEEQHSVLRTLSRQQRSLRQPSRTPQ
jgi:hypothetical protein